MQKTTVLYNACILAIGTKEGGIMSPVRIKKVDGYRVSTPHGTKAKSTTLAKAKRQRNLLNAVEASNWRPTGAKARSLRKKKK